MLFCFDVVFSFFFLCFDTKWFFHANHMHDIFDAGTHETLTTTTKNGQNTKEKNVEQMDEFWE